MDYFFSFVWFLGFRIVLLFSEIGVHLSLKTLQLEDRYLTEGCGILDKVFTHVQITLWIFFLFDLFVIYLKRQKLDFTLQFLKYFNIFVFIVMWMSFEANRSFFSTIKCASVYCYFLTGFFYSMFFFPIFPVTKCLFSVRKLRFHSKVSEKLTLD